jgi:hypothetical protein
MNFDDAINAHTKWKVRLRMCIDGTEKLDPAVVCKDNQCDLGKWIYGEGAKYNKAASYSTLKAEHANFHKCAADVVTKANAGKKAEAEALLGPTGNFAKASQATVSAIMKMKKEAA